MNEIFGLDSGDTILISFGCGFERYKIPVQLPSSLHKENRGIGLADLAVFDFLSGRGDWI